MLPLKVPNTFLHLLLAGIIPGLVQSQDTSGHKCSLLHRFPPPHLNHVVPASDPILGRYLKDLTTIFNEFSSNSSVAGFNTSVTSFSIIIAHPHHNEHTKGGPIWQYHHTAEIRDPRGTDKVTSDTVFRVGSVSKLVTMVGVVKAGLDLESSIVEYIPELKTGKHKGAPIHGMRAWEDVTLRSLGSHLAGVQRDFGWTEVSAFDTSNKLPGLNEIYQNLGLPPLDEKEFPPCEFPPYNPQPCTDKQLLEIIASHPPVIPTFSQPVYSNTAFALLAMAVERVKKTTFEKFLQKEVFGPLNMTRTSFINLANDSDGSIPAIFNSWDYDTAKQTPGGGLFSTSSDLSKLLLSLLPSLQNHKPLFSPHPTAAQKFLLPSSLVQSTNNLVLGAPWEIFRPQPNHGDLTIYTKSGSLQGYSAQTVLVPEYDVVISIVASGGFAADPALNAILSYLDDGKEKGLLVGGFGEVAKRETAEEYDGVYSAKSDKLNSTIELQTDRTSPSGTLLVTKWISNGTNFLDTLAGIRKYKGGASELVARLYPVSLFGNTVSNAEKHAKYIRHEEWKLVIERKEQPSNSTPGPDNQQGKVRSFLDDVCFSFSVVELGGRWGDEALSRVVIWKPQTNSNKRKDREAISIEIPALRVIMDRA